MRRSLSLLIVVVAAVGTTSMWLPLLSLDEQSNVVYGGQLLNGRVPHRDFFATYGPANYWLISGAFAAFGPSVESQRLIGLLYHLAIAGAIYFCCSSRGNRVAIAAAVTSVLLLTPIASISYAWLGGLALVLFSLALLQRASSPFIFAVAGVVGASCAWWRPEMLAMAGCAALPFLLPVSGRRFAYFAGFGAAIIVMVGYTAIFGLEWLTNVMTRLGVDAGYEQADRLVILGAAVVAALGVGMGVCGLRRRERTCISVAIITATAFPQLLQRPDMAHLTFVACAVVPLSIAHVIPSLESQHADASLPPSRLLRLEIDIWLVSALAIVAVMGLNGVLERSRGDVVHVRAGNRSIIADSASAPLIITTLDSLNRASAGAPVFIGAEDMSKPTLTWAMFYHLLPPESVRAYYLEIPPGLNTAQAARLGQDVRASKALLLTPFAEPNRQALFPNVKPIPDDANRAVRDAFRLHEHTPFGDVLVRSAMGS